MAERETFQAHGPTVLVDPGDTKMRFVLCRMDLGVRPNPAWAAKLVAAALNAHEPAVKAARDG